VVSSVNVSAQSSPIGWISRWRNFFL
jgi:hypothetical protein